MSRPDMTDLLEKCIQRVAAGATISEVVAAYPDQADELRALLSIALDAVPRSEEMRVPGSAQVDSRRRFLARAEELQQRPGIFGFWERLVSYFRGNIGSVAFAVGVLLLLFIALGSLRVLPGDGLAAEQAGSSLSASPAESSVFDTRRAEAVAQMIQAGRTGSVNFGGFLSKPTSGGWEAADIPLEGSEELNQQAQGLEQVYVEITGLLNSQGSVQVETLEPLLEPLDGTITAINADGWQIGSQFVRVTSLSKVTGTPRVGSRAVIQAASYEDTQRRLVISAEVSGGVQASETPTASPTVTKSPEPTQTQEPTRVTRTPKPTQQPDDDHSGQGSGSEDEDHPDDNNGSSDDQSEKEDSSGHDDSPEKDH